MSGTNCRVDTSVNEQSRPRETYWVFEKADDCRDAGGRATQDAKAENEVWAKKSDFEIGYKRKRRPKGGE